MQGFQGDHPSVTLDNVAEQSQAGTRTLAVRWTDERPDNPVVATTPTFIPPEAIVMPGLYASWHPDALSRSEVRARLAAHPGNAGRRGPAPIRYYGERDELQTLTGSPEALSGRDAVLAWRIPQLGGAPVAEVGVAVEPAEAGAGAVYLDWLTWDGAPDVELRRRMLRARCGDGPGWTGSISSKDAGRSPTAFPRTTAQGLISQGTANWIDYRVTADVSILLAKQGGIAARVGGMRRWYALLLCDDGMARLVKDREAITTGEHPSSWSWTAAIGCH